MCDQGHEIVCNFILNGKGERSRAKIKWDTFTLVINNKGLGSLTLSFK